MDKQRTKAVEGAASHAQKPRGRMNRAVKPRALMAGWPLILIEISEGHTFFHSPVSICGAARARTRHARRSHCDGPCDRAPFPSSPLRAQASRWRAGIQLLGPRQAPLQA